MLHSGHPDEGTIHAWLDGELPAAQSAALEAHLAGCVACAATVAEARGVIAGASRVVRALDAERSAPAAGAAPRWGAGGAMLPQGAPRRFRVTPARAAIAATVLVVVGLTLARGRAAQDGALIPPPAEMRVAASSPRSAATPAAARDPLLDSAIARNVAKAMPPRTLERTPGLDVPAAPPIPASAAQLAATDAAPSARVAEGRMARAAARDSAPVVADAAAAGVSARVAGAPVAPAAPAAPAAPPRCLRLESPVEGAVFGPLVLPVTVALEGIGTGAIRGFGADSATLANSNSGWRRQQGDTLVLSVGTRPRGATARLSDGGDRLAGTLRGGRWSAGAPSVPVTARQVPCAE